MLTTIQTCWSGFGPFASDQPRTRLQDPRSRRSGRQGGFDKKGQEPTFTGPSPNRSGRHKCEVYDTLKRALSIPRAPACAKAIHAHSRGPPSEAFELRWPQFADCAEKSVVTGWCRQIAHVGVQTVWPDRTRSTGLPPGRRNRWVSVTCSAPLSSLIAQFLVNQLG